MTRPRARDLGLKFGKFEPGPHNAITDVPGVRVGHETIVGGDGPLVVGTGPVRTGVTVIVPHDGDVWREPVFAGVHTLNGCGEMTGLEWVRESGTLSSPIGLTNTHSVGVVRDALIGLEFRPRQGQGAYQFGLPVVAETYDGLLSDIDGQHVTEAHVAAALAGAAAGQVEEGNVGGGTGMMCHGFKGGIGTASRRVPGVASTFTVGVLVQANHGRRDRLEILGVKVGKELSTDVIPDPTADLRNQMSMPEGAGSVIIVVATDAPMLPKQCERLAQRAGFGIARMGAVGEAASGDIFLCFSTGNRGLSPVTFGESEPESTPARFISNTFMTDFFDAVIDATEEAIVNALLAADTMTGRGGVTVHAIDVPACVEILRARGVLCESTTGQAT
ncbi:P1 family peptidase [Dactylosporangium fulvum]|uniref:P1 family peptidase n=1 Tax=Dactylosporangium fulvum TaxID=53359 RepID=A0ABY5W884_9ACTN|nr:P1 family peptidase [Dactylosporangium fulvum]UWP85565.1 P1 family peptidase [Dactylosporangium fulvum]